MNVCNVWDSEWIWTKSLGLRCWGCKKGIRGDPRWLVAMNGAEIPGAAIGWCLGYHSVWLLASVKGCAMGKYVLTIIGIADLGLKLGWSFKTMSIRTVSWGRVSGVGIWQGWPGNCASC